MSNSPAVKVSEVSETSCPGLGARIVGGLRRVKYIYVVLGERPLGSSGDPGVVRGLGMKKNISDAQDVDNIC